MSATRDPDQILHAWLEEGPTTLPAPTVRAIVVATRATTQRRPALRLPWRPNPMPFNYKFLGAAAALAIVLVGGAMLLGPRNDQSSVGGSSPSPTPSATTESSPMPSLASLDTTKWTPYVSERYGFTLAYPAGWEVRSADHEWTVEGDATNWLSTGHDAFVSTVGDGIRLSVWSVTLEPGTTPGSWAQIEAWVEAYCEQSGNKPCVGIHARVVPLCLEKRDCHPGLLVPFQNDVQAFFTGGGSGDPLVVVAVWWGESQPAVAPYGGSRRLLEAFLSTMNVWTIEMTPCCGNRDAAATFLETGN